MTELPTLKDLDRINLTVDGEALELYTRLSPAAADDVPRLVIAAKLPDPKAFVLLMLCIETVRRFTDTPYELWVVDNNSPLECLHDLMDETGLNLVLIRTAAKEPGSYENALALEVAAHLVSPSTRYFMTLHQDTAVCKTGWLRYLLTKLDDRVRATGVREDRVRVKTGILHVLGYMVDFRLFRSLGLTFFPRLPDYDVGDLAIVKIKEAGYETMAAPNSLWDKSLVDGLPQDSIFRDINVDRSFDDAGDVFFLHLGRGVVKATGAMVDPAKTNIDMWADFINEKVLLK